MQYSSISGTLLKPLILQPPLNFFIARMSRERAKRATLPPAQEVPHDA